MVYQGKIQIAAPSLNPSASYAANMRAITVTLTWTNPTGQAWNTIGAMC